MSSFFQNLSSPDVQRRIHETQASLVAAPLLALAAFVFAGRVLRRFIPETRRSASRLSPSYRRALRSAKKPRGLKFRRRQ